MADHTEIAWCDSTFNPWIGCTKVGPGCDNCYAAQQDSFRKWTPAGWGAGLPRKRTSDHLWHAPLAWNAKPFYECLDCGRRFAPPTKRLPEGWVTCPGCGKHEGRMVDNEAEAANVKQVRRRVFCASLADVFDNEVPVAWRADLFALIAATPELDWLLLTKRIGNAKTMMADALHLVPAANRDGMIWPLPNVWLGATIVTQEEADRDIPKLLATPARLRFLSMEPLLGEVDITPQLWGRPKPCWDCPKDADCECGYLRRGFFKTDGRLDWVIVGGESGHGARAFDLTWAESIVQQCRAAGVPVFVKQLGDNPCRTDGSVIEIRDHGRKGKDLHTWPEGLRVREFPEVRHA